MDLITDELLLYLVDFKAFIFNGNPLEQLRIIFLHKGHEELLNLFLNQEIDVEGLNTLTSSIINYFDMNECIHLDDLKNYVNRDDTYV
ncbi:hypothetical protein OA45_04882 [Bacillus sp. UMTAT18]|nr:MULTISPECIES: hypothetical protein [unclassified Bacillus (in: firmicutes)]KKC52761.1 hypothetical protein OA45_04882 [Bacillus sp. UMTAT18]